MSMYRFFDHCVSVMSRRRGSGPRQQADQRAENARLFGVSWPARGTGAVTGVQYTHTEAMLLHLREISRHAGKGVRAVLLLDWAGWHTTTNPDVRVNKMPVFLPSRATELSSVDDISQ